jgi:hypothetical protein
MIAQLDRLILCVGGPLDGESHRYCGELWDELPGGFYALLRSGCEEKYWWRSAA